MSDPLIRLLSTLPPAEPDPARAERIRARCRARLARPLSGATVSGGLAPRGPTAQLWQPLGTILGVAYLTEVIIQALRLYGLP